MMNNDKEKTQYRELVAAADTAWKRGDMAEWERLVPLAEAALAESGIEVRTGFPWQFHIPGRRAENN